MKLIPERAVLFMGEDKTITVRVRRDLGIDEVAVEVEPEGVVEILNDGNVGLEPHKKRHDVLTGQIRLRPLVEDKETLLTASCNGYSAPALVEVRPERITPEPVEIEPPTSLQFERETYRVAWGKKRRLVILAPADLVAEEGNQVRVSSEDPGVAVLGGLPRLELDDELECCTGEVEVEARTTGARARISARLGSVVATCNVIVARDTIGPSLHFRLVDEERGHRRAVVVRSEENLLMEIMARHPGIRRYLGPGPDFPHQDKSACRGILAEIIAGESVRMVLEAKFPPSGAEEIDGARLYVEHSRYMRKYLPRCNRMLVPERFLA